MSELHVPPEVADAMRALRPELRKKLSLRDIDDMTRPFRERIRELEDERDIFARTLDKRDAENKRLLEAIKRAPCPEGWYTGEQGFCSHTCDCWKRKALEGES